MKTASGLCAFILASSFLIPGCGSYTDIGTVSGDQGSDSIDHYNSGEKWYRVYVSEANTDAVYLSAMLILTPPAGGDYDLFVYCDNYHLEIHGNEAVSVRTCSTI